MVRTAKLLPLRKDCFLQASAAQRQACMMAVECAKRDIEAHLLGVQISGPVRKAVAGRKEMLSSNIIVYILTNPIDICMSTAS